MKKRVLACLLALSMVTGLAACSGNQEGAGEADTAAAAEAEEAMAYLSGFDPADYVDVAPYKEFTVEVQPKAIIDDADVQAEIDSFMAQNEELVEVTDRTDVQTGDIVNIDFTGKKDGEAFDGGTAEGYDLEIGSGSFIAGFEEGLIGHQVGESLELPLTFPEDYGSEELAGQDVVFEVTINSIQRSQIPALTDEFIAGNGIVDEDGKKITNVEEFRAYERDQLQMNEDNNYNENLQSAILNYLVDNSTFTQDLPGALVDRINGAYVEMFTSYADMYGIDLATFMSYYGSTAETYEEDIREMAVVYSRQLVVLGAIADAEGLNVTDEELQAKLEEEAASYGFTSVEEMTEGSNIEMERENLMGNRVLEYLAGIATVVAPQPAAGSTAAEASTAAPAEASTQAPAEEN